MSREHATVSTGGGGGYEFVFFLTGMSVVLLRSPFSNLVKGKEYFICERSERNFLNIFFFSLNVELMSAPKSKLTRTAENSGKVP